MLIEYEWGIWADSESVMTDKEAYICHKEKKGNCIFILHFLSNVDVSLTIFDFFVQSQLRIKVRLLSAYKRNKVEIVRCKLKIAL